MIRFYEASDYKSVNGLLSSFDSNIDLNSNPFYKCLVYEKENILGVIVFEEIYERIELDYIIVDKNYRKCGIACKLIEYLINYAKKKNILNITLEVNENNIAAINLYKKYEFEFVSKRDKYYKDNDAILMIRKFDNYEWYLYTGNRN